MLSFTVIATELSRPNIYQNKDKPGPCLVEDEINWSVLINC